MDHRISDHGKRYQRRALSTNSFCCSAGSRSGDDRPVGGDQVGVAREQPVDGPVGAEHAPIDAEGLDAAEHPGSQRLDAPALVDHPETRDLARCVRPRRACAIPDATRRSRRCAPAGSRRGRGSASSRGTSRQVAALARSPTGVEVVRHPVLLQQPVATMEVRIDQVVARGEVADARGTSRGWVAGERALDVGDCIRASPTSRTAALDPADVTKSLS